MKEGDALESGTFEQHMADCDVVMSCLGGKGLKSSGVPAYSNSMKEINKAMEKYCYISIILPLISRFISSV